MSVSSFDSQKYWFGSSEGVSSGDNKGAFQQSENSIQRSWKTALSSSAASESSSYKTGSSAVSDPSSFSSSYSYSASSSDSLSGTPQESNDALGAASLPSVKLPGTPPKPNDVLSAASPSHPTSPRSFRSLDLNDLINAAVFPQTDIVIPTIVKTDLLSPNRDEIFLFDADEARAFPASSSSNTHSFASDPVRRRQSGLSRPMHSSADPVSTPVAPYRNELMPLLREPKVESVDLDSASSNLNTRRFPGSPSLSDVDERVNDYPSFEFDFEM